MKAEKPLYIFDLDGTLALIDHRRHLVQRMDCERCGNHGNVVIDMPLGISGSLAGHFRLVKCPDCGGASRKPDDWAPDWPAFFAACPQDSPNSPVIDTLRQLARSGAEIRIWSGRSAVVMNETLAWLQGYVFTPGSRVDPDKVELCMRREGDFTPDEVLKAAWLDALPPSDRRRLVAVFDDRDKVVAMWRAKGVACFQVAPGEF